MRKNGVRACAALVTSLALVPGAQAQQATDAVQVSVGVKVWNSSWLSYLVGLSGGVDPSGKPGLADVIDQVEGKRETSALPLLAVRYGKYFVSGSVGHYASDFYVAHSSVIGPGGVNVLTSRSDHFSRRESDVSLGYFVTPEVAVTLGYKYATEDRDTALGLGPQYSSRMRSVGHGPLVGALGSFPIQGALRFYGQLGYGPAKLKTEFPGTSEPRIDANSRYLLSEIGLAYALPVGGTWAKGANAALGYRSQTLTTHSYGPAYRDPRDVRDVKDGIVLSLTVTL
jgi:hypothetical protein